MVEDTKMTDEKKTEEDTAEEEEATKVMPPLEASSRRLERLLGGGGNREQILHSYTNPAKVIRRWLGTSSGASAKATADDIKSAAATLLDPNGPCARGRNLIVSEQQQAMDVETEQGYLKVAAREVESWLISLAVRLLWKEHKYTEALDLSQKGIEIALSHLEEASTKITTTSVVSASSLFPLLARLYRFRSLVAEAMNDPAINASLRIDMTKGHNMASVRRDVDSQATLLNCMLRDLLRHSQGKFVLGWVGCLRCNTFISPALTLGACSGTGKQAPCELDVPGICVEQPALSLPVLQWTYPITPA